MSAPEELQTEVLLRQLHVLGDRLVDACRAEPYDAEHERRWRGIYDATLDVYLARRSGSWRWSPRPC